MDALLELTLLAEAADKNKRLSNRASDYERVAYFNGQYAAYLQAIRIFKERINESRKGVPEQA
jgi:hypothetical protein